MLEVKSRSVRYLYETIDLEEQSETVVTVNEDSSRCVDPTEQVEEFVQLTI